MEWEKQATEAWHHAQVCTEALRRRVVIEVLTIIVLEFQELSWTPGVDQEVELAQGKGKGPERVLVWARAMKM